MIKIIVVEDHAVLRNCLCRFLGTEDDMEITGTAADGKAAMVLLKGGLQADIMLTDFNMPGMDGLELTRQAVSLREDLRVIVLTFSSELKFRQLALAAGAEDCLSKYNEPAELLAAIRAAHAA